MIINFNQLKHAFEHEKAYFAPIDGISIEFENDNVVIAQKI